MQENIEHAAGLILNCDVISEREGTVSSLKTPRVEICEPMIRSSVSQTNSISYLGCSKASR